MRRSVFVLTCTLVIMLITLSIPQTIQANPFTPRLVVNPQRPSDNPFQSDYRLSFQYNIEKSMPSVDAFSYILDYQPRVYLSFEASDINMTIYTPHPPLRVVDGTRYRVFKTLENLADGNYPLKVYAHFSNGTIKTIIDTKIIVDSDYVDPLTPHIVSPPNQTTINTRQVPLVYTTNEVILWSYYTLDNLEMTYFEGNITLPTLFDGLHTLTLAVIYNITTTDSMNQSSWSTKSKGQTVTFYVDTMAPRVANISVDGTESSDLLLNIAVDENTSWAGYSLDNQANITINGDTVLKDLPYGVHTVTVYANDTAGNTTSETYIFTVQESFKETLATHSLTITIGIVSTAAVSGGILAYLRRNKLANRQVDHT